MADKHRYILTLSCPDRVGIVAAVSGFIASRRGWIVEASHHADQDSRRFFMRQEILADSLPFDAAGLCAEFAPIAREFAMDWNVTDNAVRKRLVILVSKQEHCLYDLLARWQARELDVEIPCVISNHENFRGIVEWHGIPYHHVEMAPETREAAHQRVMALFEEARGDTMVLARYMQILPPQMCARYRGRIINIHHSFLPSFAGAKPYQQAFMRGVKLIGATCHYASEELDQGPIIEQDVIRVDHSDTPEDLMRYGKDIEKTVLARGLRYHLEDRVLIDGNKTVVFR
ncbi:MAG TPA: formyltetrahydrofolate deformylase [Burkholderiales bacterium]|nr:formyltetrahydrofolate deformylase [Burkholderiales bacterium]